MFHKYLRTLSQNRNCRKIRALAEPRNQDRQYLKHALEIRCCRDTVVKPIRAGLIGVESRTVLVFHSVLALTQSAMFFAKGRTIGLRREIAWVRGRLGLRFPALVLSPSGVLLDDRSAIPADPTRLDHEVRQAASVDRLLLVCPPDRLIYQGLHDFFDGRNGLHILANKGIFCASNS